MEKRRAKHSIEMIYPLLFILVFCFCVILVVLSGANIYQKTTAGLQENYTVRTAVPYLQEKIRECKRTEQIEILTGEEGVVLALYGDEDRREYATYIYLKDGYLRELFTRKSKEPSYEAGQTLVELDSFTAQLENGILQIQVKKDEAEETFLIKAGESE